MGAWGHGNFENDEAMDWLGDLESLSADDLEQLLEKTAKHSGYLEAPDASVALAAAEVVAALKGSPCSDLPKEVTAWIKHSKAKPTPKLADAALKAVTRVKTDSELKELWEEGEGEEGKQWNAALQDLERRLK